MDFTKIKMIRADFEQLYFNDFKDQVKMRAETRNGTSV